MKNRFFMALVALTVFAACTKEEPNIAVPQLSEETIQVNDLPADTGSTNQYTFYSLKSQQLVAREDSASAAWDIAFQGTTIRVNSGVSGPGSVKAQMISGLFDELVSFPASGYSEDTEQALAIPSGSGNGWYSYNQEAHTINAIPGRLILLDLGTAYGKIEIISYYKGAPENPTSVSPSRYYTFKYQIVNK